MEKHKLALTVQNRVISLKFSTHRLSKKCTLGNFQKIFLFPKLAAILNFRIFAKNRETVICFYLLNKRLIGWTLHMIMCVLLCYPVSIHMSQLQATGRPISSLFIYFGFHVTFNTVQVISRRVVGRAEETSTYSWSRFCTVNCQPTASNYQLSHLRSGREPNPSLRGGRRECPVCLRMRPNLVHTKAPNPL